MLTNSDLRGDLTLIYAYQKERRKIEAEFLERIKLLDREFEQKIRPRIGSNEYLDIMVLAKLKANKEMSYRMALEEIDKEVQIIT